MIEMFKRRTNGESLAYLQGLKAGSSLVLRALDSGKTLVEAKESTKDILALVEAITPSEPSDKTLDLAVRAHRRPSTGL